MEAKSRYAVLAKAMTFVKSGRIPVVGVFREGSETSKTGHNAAALQIVEYELTEQLQREQQHAKEIKVSAVKREREENTAATARLQSGLPP